MEARLLSALPFLGSSLDRTDGKRCRIEPCEINQLLFYLSLPSIPQPVAQILLSTDGHAQGVVLQDGTEVKSRLVLSNASPQLTFLVLTPQVSPALWHSTAGPL